MRRDDIELDPGALIRLRDVARTLHRENGVAVPLGRLVDLARQARLNVGVTIDFDASIELGQPFVVLRVPAESRSSGCLSNLSKREREVAALICEGLGNKQIASRLHITLATVKDHVHHILRKSGLPNRTAVATTMKSSRIFVPDKPQSTTPN
jgi:DNA-binding CsgD family transcriptional regulator